MTSYEWKLLSDAFINEHNRVWESASTDKNLSRMQFALELQSYALIAGAMAEKLLEQNK